MRDCFMGSDKNTWLQIVLPLQLFTFSCEDPTNHSLSSLQYSTPAYEAFIQQPPIGPSYKPVSPSANAYSNNEMEFKKENKEPQIKSSSLPLWHGPIHSPPKPHIPIPPAAGHPPLPLGPDELEPGIDFPPFPLVGGPLPGSPFGRCGNGVRELREQCDDGNQDNYDGCNILCEFSYCGNGITEFDEECDDGNTVDGDGCSNCCLYEWCGNGRLDTVNGIREECDDGNNKAGDGCSPCCLFEKCGNCVVDPGEECDDGNLINADGCSDCCKIDPPCAAPSLATS
jgi:cysteine-rich repeat protein